MSEESRYISSGTHKEISSSLSLTVSLNMAGCNCNWNYLLATSMGDRKERPSFHGNVHSTSAYYYSHHVSILVERELLLGKVHTSYSIFHFHKA